MAVTWMKLKAFCTMYGVPVSVMTRAVHGQYSHQIARKADPNKVNSPWIINVQRALELWEGGYI